MAHAGLDSLGHEIERTLFSPADNESEEAEAKRQRIEAEAG
jgi:hypothetical protein